MSTDEIKPAAEGLTELVADDVASVVREGMDGAFIRGRSVGRKECVIDQLDAIGAQLHQPPCPCPTCHVGEFLIAWARSEGWQPKAE